MLTSSFGLASVSAYCCVDPCIFFHFCSTTSEQKTVLHNPSPSEIYKAIHAQPLPFSPALSYDSITAMYPMRLSIWAGWTLYSSAAPGAEGKLFLTTQDPISTCHWLAAECICDLGCSHLELIRRGLLVQDLHSTGWRVPGCIDSSSPS